MPDDDKQFVEIPTMTIRKPKKKASSAKFLIASIAIMGAGIAIVAIAVYLLL